MGSVSPDIEGTAGEQRLATGDTTFFGNTFGKLTGKNAWHVGPTTSRLQRGYQRQRPPGYGHPS